jgi:hypothetical protein
MLFATATTMAQADISYTLRFEPIAAGTRMPWSGQLQPKGVFRLPRPGYHLAWDTPGTADTGEPEIAPGSRTGGAVGGRVSTNTTRDYALSRCGGGPWCERGDHAAWFRCPA